MFRATATGKQRVAESHMPEEAEALIEKGSSLLQRVMSAFENESGLSMSFDDNTGYNIGVHNDVSTMHVSWHHLQHACDFCMFAKQTRRGLLDCVRNKLAVQRLIVRRRSGFHGLCHLGLLDIAEPFIYQGHFLGVFYYGSVVVRGQETTSREKIRRYCKRVGLSPQPYLIALKKRPVIDSDKIPHYHESLRTVIHLARHLCEAAGVQPDFYPIRTMSFPISDPKALPYVVKETMRYVARHIDQPFKIKDIATHLGCHPDYLSRKFKTSTDLELSAYIARLRIDRSLSLLRNPKLTIDQVVGYSGFSDRSQFGRLFLRSTGTTPAAYRKGLID